MKKKPPRTKPGKKVLFQRGFLRNTDELPEPKPRPNIPWSPLIRAQPRARPYISRRLHGNTHRTRRFIPRDADWAEINGRAVKLDALWPPEPPARACFHGNGLPQSGCSEGCGCGDGGSEGCQEGGTGGTGGPGSDTGESAGIEAGAGTSTGGSTAGQAGGTGEAGDIGGGPEGGIGCGQGGGCDFGAADMGAGPSGGPEGGVGCGQGGGCDFGCAPGSDFGCAPGGPSDFGTFGPEGPDFSNVDVNQAFAFAPTPAPTPAPSPAPDRQEFSTFLYKDPTPADVEAGQRAAEQPTEQTQPTALAAMFANNPSAQLQLDTALAQRGSFEPGSQQDILNEQTIQGLTTGAFGPGFAPGTGTTSVDVNYGSGVQARPEFGGGSQTQPGLDFATTPFGQQSTDFAQTQTPENIAAVTGGPFDQPFGADQFAGMQLASATPFIGTDFQVGAGLPPMSPSDRIGTAFDALTNPQMNEGFTPLENLQRMQGTSPLGPGEFAPDTSAPGGWQNVVPGNMAQGPGIAPPTERAPIGGDFNLPAGAGAMAGIFGSLAGGSQQQLAAGNIYQGGPGALAFMGAGGIMPDTLTQQAREQEQRAQAAEPVAGGADLEPVVSPDTMPEVRPGPAAVTEPEARAAEQRAAEGIVAGSFPADIGGGLRDDWRVSDQPEGNAGAVAAQTPAQMLGDAATNLSPALDRLVNETLFPGHGTNISPEANQLPPEDFGPFDPNLPPPMPEPPGPNPAPFLPPLISPGAPGGTPITPITSDAPPFPFGQLDRAERAAAFGQAPPAGTGLGSGLYSLGAFAREAQRQQEQPFLPNPSQPGEYFPYYPPVTPQAPNAPTLPGIPISDTTPPIGGPGTFGRGAPEIWSSQINPLENQLGINDIGRNIPTDLPPDVAPGGPQIYGPGQGPLGPTIPAGPQTGIDSIIQNLLGITPAAAAETQPNGQQFQLVPGVADTSQLFGGNVNNARDLAAFLGGPPPLSGGIDPTLPATLADRFPTPTISPATIAGAQAPAPPEGQFPPPEESPADRVAGGFGPFAPGPEYVPPTFPATVTPPTETRDERNARETATIGGMFGRGPEGGRDTLTATDRAITNAPPISPATVLGATTTVSPNTGFPQLELKPAEPETGAPSVLDQMGRTIPPVENAPLSNLGMPWGQGRPFMPDFPPPQEVDRTGKSDLQQAPRADTFADRFGNPLPAGAFPGEQPSAPPTSVLDLMGRTIPPVENAPLASLGMPWGQGRPDWTFPPLADRGPPWGPGLAWPTAPPPDTTTPPTIATTGTPLDRSVFFDPNLFEGTPRQTFEPPTPPPPMGGEGRGIYAGGPYDWTGPPPMTPRDVTERTPPTLDELRVAPIMDPRTLTPPDLPSPLDDLTLPRVLPSEPTARPTERTSRPSDEQVRQTVRDVQPPSRAAPVVPAYQAPYGYPQSQPYGGGYLRDFYPGGPNTGGNPYIGPRADVSPYGGGYPGGSPYGGGPTPADLAYALGLGGGGYLGQPSMALSYDQALGMLGTLRAQAAAGDLVAAQMLAMLSPAFQGGPNIG